ncbi:hypothetical protein [Burkholderia alba]|uniref:hypothetical protein n=1 Tax=Burkholderia alba TaxID=2683677 RepID=UPI002B05FFFC|nr:hypothetical protein [Burkholderia alba]
MQLLSAALLSAAAAWPFALHAQTAAPAPASPVVLIHPDDPAAEAPAAAPPAPLAAYRPYRDGAAPSWPALNREVAPRPAQAAGTGPGRASAPADPHAEHAR